MSISARRIAPVFILATQKPCEWCHGRFPEQLCSSDRSHFTALDPFKALALDKIVGAYVRGSELSGARLQGLLDGFPGIPFDGDPGKSVIVGSDLNGVNSLDHAQQVTETEGGVLFADASGTVVLQDRHYRPANERTVRATYGDVPPEMRIESMEPLIDETRLFTAATVTPSSGRVFSALELEPALQHFVRTKEVVTLHANDNDAQAMAEVFALRYATPRTRIPSLLLQPAGDPTDALTMWEAVLSHEISHRIRTVERPLGDATWWHRWSRLQTPPNAGPPRASGRR